MTPEQLLDLKLAEPEPTQSVVRFQVAFPNDPKTYSYAAIRAAGKWYITGRDGAVGRNWNSLIDLLTRDNATIYTAKLATTLEDLL